MKFLWLLLNKGNYSLFKGFKRETNILGIFCI